LRRRRAARGATAIAAVTCAYAATALGKAWFALPRPPGAIGPADVPAWLPSLLSAWYEAQVLSDGFGFSSHATGGAAAYLALALVYDRAWTGQRRLLAAVLVAVAVAASRVVIEVHYLVDVLAGLAVGGGVVLGALWLAGDPRVRRGGSAESEGGFDSRGATAALDPTLPFLLAAVVSTGALAVTVVAGGHTGEVVEGNRDRHRRRRRGRLATCRRRRTRGPGRIAVPALAVTGGLWVGAYVFAGSVAVTLAATTAAVVAVVALPALPERIERMSGAWN